MHSINNVYISGLGAIGMTFAGLIHEADPGCLRVIADEARIQRYTREGTAINGKPVVFRYLRSDEGAPPADLLIIAVKHHQLEQSIHDIRNFIGENTTILSLLNGIVNEETIGAAYGAEKLLYSYVVGTDATREGTHVHYLHQGRIVFGERSNKELSPRVSAIKDFFDRTGIPCEIPEDMIQELWWKLMLNVGVNQVSAVLKTPYGVFHNICSLRAEGKTSLLQDIKTHRETEVEIFFGTVMKLGCKYRFAMPIKDMLFKMIRTMEKM